MRELSIAIIARDKFSRVAESVRSLIGELPSNSIVYLFDPGYPKSILNEIHNLTENYALPLVIVGTERFANVNLVWNQFVEISDSQYLMCLENDVVVNPECIKNTLASVVSGECDIAVPVVLENKIDQLNIPHFNPRTSDIVRLENGNIQSILDRGRADAEPMPTPRAVKHLERHCFIFIKDAARRLGLLDTQMYCRTDYDMSIQCHINGLVIRIPAASSVTFTQYPKDIEIDREFFDFRWNVDRVAFANARLISKWHLEGFKTTITHAYEARKYLSNEAV